MEFRTDSEALEKRSRPVPRRITIKSRRHQGFGDKIDRGNAGDDTEELAHVSERPATGRENEAWRCRDKIDEAVVMSNHHAPAIGQIVAVERAQQGRLPGTRGPGQHHASAAFNLEIEITEHRQPGTTLQMEGKGLGQPLDDDHPVHG